MENGINDLLIYTLSDKQIMLTIDKLKKVDKTKMRIILYVSLFIF